MSANYSDGEFGNKAEGFDAPISLPSDEAQRQAWQNANKAWWESTPMRYDWRDKLHDELGSGAYFDEIDYRFLDSVRRYMPWRKIPFDPIIPFDELHDQDVLEIGVGQGTHAAILAQRCRSFTGIDLTAFAAGMTSKRLKLLNISANIQQMDAERLDFPNNAFDYIWSWGVIHHSADTRRVLEEMHRVLRPGGKCTVMIYHRSWWSYYFCGLLRRTFQRQMRANGNLHQVNQKATDGAIARYYTPREWRATTRGLFAVDTIQIYGLKAELIPLPYSRLKLGLERLLPDVVARVLLRRLQMGSFLVAQMRKA